LLDALSKKEEEMQAEVRRTLAQEFFDFLKTFGIIGLAIAFVIGQAAGRLVTAFVNDIIDPIIGLFLPAGSLETLMHPQNPPYAHLDHRNMSLHISSCYSVSKP
jgi:large-conductance mechanosensitive channel